MSGDVHTYNSMKDNVTRNASSQLQNLTFLNACRRSHLPAPTQQKRVAPVILMLVRSPTTKSPFAYVSQPLIVAHSENCPPLDNVTAIMHTHSRSLPLAATLPTWMALTCTPFPMST